MAKGKLPLNDMAGGAGRMDVLVRALMASILTSHGIRKDVEFTMILLGGPDQQEESNSFQMNSEEYMQKKERLQERLLR